MFDVLSDLLDFVDLRSSNYGFLGISMVILSRVILCFYCIIFAAHLSDVCLWVDILMVYDDVAQ